jgi:hypothetical protein
MASEEHADVSVHLPADLEEWLDQRAAETDRSRDDLVADLVGAYRSMTENGVVDGVLTEDDLATDGTVDDLEGLVASTDLDAALESQREEFSALLEDVRKRVVQVKRETDAKAHVDHEHDDLESTLGDVESTVEALEESIDALEEDLDDGFENFEDVLEYLTETTDELESKTGTLAQLLVDLRGEVKRLSAREARRAEADALKLAANREDVESAKCEECETAVTISLLTAPECPHCASTFNDVEKRSGLFSSNKLVTGAPPALPEPTPGGLETSADLVEELADVTEDAEE